MERVVLLGCPGARRRFEVSGQDPGGGDCNEEQGADSADEWECHTSVAFDLFGHRSPGKAGHLFSVTDSPPPRQPSEQFNPGAPRRHLRMLRPEDIDAQPPKTQLGRSHPYGQLVGGGLQPASATCLKANADANASTLTLRKLDGSVAHEVRVGPVRG